jgi:osmoprotectant transport system ATP-binding protein
VIRLDSVSKRFGDAARYSVRDVSFEVEPESLLVLLGESGSGKTTTLKMINRLIEPTTGRILVEGADVLARDPVELRRHIGYVFQDIGLFPHMSVADNVAVVPELLGWDAGRTRARVDDLLGTMGLAPGEFRERYPEALSGGQRQRVGVARALAAAPKVLLMDEPFGALDPITRDELQRELKRWQRALGLTIVLVTHDVTEALLLADRIGIMKDGRLLAHDTPQRLLADPADDYVARLMAMPSRQAREFARLTGEADA